MNPNIIQKTTLNELADKLILDLKQSRDFFAGITIVVPNRKVEQWFKAYWLKTQKDILMNIDYETIDEALFSFIDGSEQYSLLKKETLRLLILKELIATKGDNLPDEVGNYIKEGDSFNSTNLYDLANELANAFAEYENCNADIADEYVDFYKHILETAKEKYKLANLSSLKTGQTYLYKTNNKTIYFFGFIDFNETQKKIINDYCSSNKDNNIIVYELIENSEKPKIPVTITTAPSKLREIEAVHTKISELLKDKDISYSDFLVVAPNIKEYETTIKRVFKQDNEEFFDIPFSINCGQPIDSDVTLILKKLIEIYHKGFYTRNDFYQIINNDMVFSIRDISDGQKESWANMIIITNVFRQKENGDDWDYIRNRVLLSKLLNINDLDNIISFKNKDYRPYSYVGMDDETIIKFVRLIDDLNSWMNTIKTIDEKGLIDVSDVGLIKQELDKWCAVTDNGIENNRIYTPICRIINDMLGYGVLDNKMPLKTFLYLLLDASKTSKNSKGKILTQGVTFTDFSKDCVLSANYVFFLGASSNNLPAKHLESEIFKVRKKPDSIEKKYFFMQYSNSLKEFDISYINKDLKTEEDFYPSTFVNELVKDIDKKLLSKNDMPLDETRNWEQLYTRREFKDKVYRDNLFKDSSDEQSENKTPDSFDTKQINKLTLSDIKAYLDEPLSFFANRLFADENNYYEDIIKEFEPFKFDPLEEHKIITEFIDIGLSKPDYLIEESDYDRAKEKLILNNGTRGFKDEDCDLALSLLAKEAQSTLNTIKESGEDVEILKLNTLVLYDGSEEWSLDCNHSLARIKVDDETRRYIELKKLPNKEKDHLYPYAYSLMDIASLKSNGEDVIYHIVLSDGTYKFDLTPKRAIEILNEIHRRINKIAEAKCLPFDLSNSEIESIENPFDLLMAVRKQKQGKWEHFDHQRSFTEEKLGFDNDFKFEQSFYEHISLLEYLKVVEEEGENDGSESI